MHHSIVYLSTPTFLPDQSRNTVGAIVAEAMQRNATFGITGTLIATEHHFAQVIEGRRDAIDPLMANILRDPRHSDVTILRDEAASARRFNGWSLAYHGRSAYFESFIRVLAAAREPQLHDITRLVDLMSRLAAPQPRRPSRDYGTS
jgi:hypothetical protein